MRGGGIQYSFVCHQANNRPLCFVRERIGFSLADKQHQRDFFFLLNNLSSGSFAKQEF